MPRSITALVDEIEANHDEFDSTAAEAEVLGTAPAALVDTMRRLRTPMVKAPLEVDGDLLALDDQLRYFEALSYANPTAGWIGFNHAGAAGMAAARLCDEGLDAIYGSNPAPFMGAVSAPSGTFEFVDGGVVATGTYRYASGVRHADWVMVPAVEVVGATERPSVRMMLVAAHDAQLGGAWDVMALKGTGSVDVVLDRVFVPTHLTTDPLVGPVRGGPRFKLGYQTYVAGENLGFTMGVCQRFLDELTAYACGKSRGADGRLADRGAFQYELGKGQLQVNAARAYGLQALAEADAACIASGSLTPAEEQAVVAMMAYCTESAANAVSHLFHFAGAGALFNTSILQRCFRDAHGSVQHHVASNVVYDRFGQTMIATREIKPTAARA